jgi:hypothetical protein
MKPETIATPNPIHMMKVPPEDVSGARRNPNMK